MKKFTKKELIKRLGMSEDNAKKVIEAQRRFPTLLTTDEEEGFVIDARTIWEELGKPQGEFNKWIKRKLVDKNYKENIDYNRFTKIVEGDSKGHGNATLKEYTLTLDCAKKVAMRENTDNGDLVCDYFISLEKAVKEMENWYNIRNPQKESYKTMCDAIYEQYKKANDGKEPNKYIYITNADMINLCLFGKKSYDMKLVLDVEYEDLLRDSLTVEANHAIHEIQLLNENLVLSNIDFQTRKQIIINTCNSKFLSIRLKIVSEFHKEFKEINKTR